MSRYDYLLFDNDGTLMDFAAAQKTAFFGAYSRSPFAKDLPCSDRLLQIYHRHNNLWWQRLERGACDKAALTLGRFQDFLAEAGLRGDPAALNTLYMEELSRQNQLIDGALEVVTALGRSHQILIVTNGVAATQHSRLGRSPLRPFLQGVYVSEEAGAGKPHKAYFDYVLKKAQIADKSRCLVIGDSLSSDIQGANNAGIDCCWYNPGGQENPGLKVLWEIQSLRQLPGLLDSEF